MKRNYLVVLAIMLSVLFAACSDSKDKFNPRETEEYAENGLAYYGLVEDVKTLTKTYYYSAEWKDGAVSKGKASEKDVTTFDQTGFMTSGLSYRAYGENMAMKQ